MTYPNSDDVTLNRLRSDFPAWRIWRGVDDRQQLSSWYATSRSEITDRAVDEGLHRTAAADFTHELRAFLDGQEQLATALRLTTTGCS